MNRNSKTLFLIGLVLFGILIQGNSLTDWKFHNIFNFYLSNYIYNIIETKQEFYDRVKRAINPGIKYRFFLYNFYK